MPSVERPGKIQGKQIDNTQTPADTQQLTFNASKNKWDAQAAGGGGSGEANTTSNSGTGEGLAQAKSGVDLPFKSIIGGTGLSAVGNTNDVTLNHDAHTGEVTGSTALSVDKSAITGQTAKASPTTGDFILITDGADTNNLKKVDIGNLPTGGGGEANTASNVGTGFGIFKQKSGVDLEFDSLIGGTGITITDTTDDLTISHDAHTGDVTGSTALTIASSAVTNAKMADMAQNTIKGRVTASTGAPEDLTAANVRSIINVADGANNYSHPNHTGDVTSTGDGATAIAAGVIVNADVSATAGIVASKLSGVVTPTSTDTLTNKTIDEDNNTLKITKYKEAIPFDFGTDVATGDGKFYMHTPPELDGYNLVYVHAEVITAGTTGTTDIQIHNVDNALDMLSTKLIIDSAETGSDTAATAAVINTANDHVNTNDVIRIDVDAVSTTAPKGLIVTLGFKAP